MTSEAIPFASSTQLSFTSWNDEKPRTIILLHGGFTCRLEFALVLPHLSAFHLLIPDLPLHSASRHVQPGTTENSAKLVSQLIRSHAHGRKAHVVGVSMGGYIGQCLALEQPEVVLSLFVTGAPPLTGDRLFMARWRTLTYYNLRLAVCWLPEWVYQYMATSIGLKLSSELMAEMRSNITWQLVQDMFPWIISFSLEHVNQLKVRMLSIAGGGAKGDDVAMVQRIGEALRSRRTEQGDIWPEDGSGAVVVRKATHGWDMQFPELFAQSVSAWVERKELPDDLERL